MTTSTVCFETDNQSVCVDPGQGDAPMSPPPEPDSTPSPAVAQWTAADQVEWNRITASNRDSNRPFSPLGVRPAEAGLGMVFFLAGCGGGGGSDLGRDDKVDNDGDGFSVNDEDESRRDCDDQNPDVHPSINEDIEICNAIDDDCNGQIDNVFGGDVDRCSDFNVDQDHAADVNRGTAFVDDDCDEYGDRSSEPIIISACEAYCGYDQCLATNNADCDDADPDVHPYIQNPSTGGPDGLILEDRDGDGYDAVIESTENTDYDGESCDEEIDCDDSNDARNPGATEITGNTTDENCNGMSDADQDGDGVTMDDGDCVDDDPAVNPSAQEVPGNDDDENCDGVVDETCEARAERRCDAENDSVYWYDSCGNREDLIQNCDRYLNDSCVRGACTCMGYYPEISQCGPDCLSCGAGEYCQTYSYPFTPGSTCCEPHADIRCWEDNLFWFSSCGYPEEMYEDCGTGCGDAFEPESDYCY